MSANADDEDRHGPLAEASRLCDALQAYLDSLDLRYPAVDDALRRLDVAIHWERDRLAWELTFITESRAREVRQRAVRNRKKAATANAAEPKRQSLKS